MSRSSRRSTTNSSTANLLLRVCCGEENSLEYYVADGLKIGRTVGNNIILDDLTIGRTHASIVMASDGSFRLRSESDENFITCGEIRTNELCLEVGTEFQIGKTKFECLSGEHNPIENQNLDEPACPFCNSTSIPPELNRAAKCFDCRQAIITINLGAEFKVPVVVPVRYGNFRAKQFVARGGMGVVLRGVEISSAHSSGDKLTPAHNPPKRQNVLDVAIKLLLPSKGSPREERRFTQEVGLLQRVEHPNVVRLIESGRVEKFNYLVMEWIEGKTLRDVIASYKRRDDLPTFDQALKVIEQLCSGLIAIHEAGIVHRDLKPSNILIDRKTKKAHISDFGISKTFNSSDAAITCLTITGETPGTYDYMAPEQRAAPDLVDVRTDIYSLGVTIYELLTGRRVYGAFSPVSKINSTVPPEFDSILNRMLSPEMGDRFSNVRDLWNEIKRMREADEEIEGIEGQDVRQDKSFPPISIPRFTIEWPNEQLGFVMLIAIAVGIFLLFMLAATDAPNFVLVPLEVIVGIAAVYGSFLVYKRQSGYEDRLVDDGDKIEESASDQIEHGSVGVDNLPDKSLLDRTESDELVCLNCKRFFEAKMESTLLGFKKYDCPFCPRTNFYPLRYEYRILYWLVLVLSLLFGVGMLMEGEIPAPGILAIAAIPALVMDRRNGRAVRLARIEAASGFHEPKVSMRNPARDPPSTEDTLPQKWHWFFSTPWWTFSAFLLCTMLLALGLDGLSVYWQLPSDEDGIFVSIVGLAGLLVGLITGPAGLLASGLRRCGRGKTGATPWRMRHQGKLLGASVIFAILGIMIPMIHAASHAVAEAGRRSAAENEEWIRYAFGRGEAFLIDIPSNWECTQNDSEATGNYMFVDRNHDDLGLFFVVIKKSDASAESIEEIRQQSIDHFHLSNKITITKDKPSDYHGRLACNTFLLYEQNGKRISHIFRHVDYSDSWVVISAWGSPSNVNDQQPMIRKIFNSVNANSHAGD